MSHLINMHQLALHALHTALTKGQYNLVTSKARSVHGFLGGIYASLCAYQLTHQNKPTIQIMESLA